MAYTKAQGKASQKYIAANLEEVRFRVKKGEKAALQIAAAAAGDSMTQYVIKAINAYAQEQILSPVEKD